MDDALRERVEALERAITDGEHDLSAVADEAEALDRLDSLDSRLTALEDGIEEVQAATQALRGYVGNIRSVNTDVEQRADAALTKVEALEQRLSAESEQHHIPTDDTELSGPAGERTAAPSHDQNTATQQDGTATPGSVAGTPESAAQADRTESRPTDGGYEQPHCHSCGRPRETQSPDGNGSRAETTQGTAATRSPSDSVRAGQQAQVSTTQNHPDHQREKPTGAVAGEAPTVESLAADQTEPTQVPSGDTDPLVGATDSSGEGGTLKRIRDLL